MRELFTAFISFLCFTSYQFSNAQALRQRHQRLSLGLSFSQIIRSDGQLRASGSNDYGQLGDGTNTPTTSFVQVGSTSNWVHIASSVNHTLAIAADGSLWAWGRNISGQLGDGTNTDQNEPVRIGAENIWLMVDNGPHHTVAVKGDGTLWAWGSNAFGQLGIGNSIDQNFPVQVGADNDWVLASAGLNFCLALKSDGSLWAWGRNNFGQLGDGTTTNSNQPILIGTDNDWIDIQAGFHHSIAIKADGTCWVWGDNLYGELGDGTNIDRDVPTLLAGHTNWRSISAGTNYTLGLKADGTMWAWGRNDFGQLGDGANTHRNSPIQIGVGKYWIDAASGGLHSMAISADGTVWSWGNNSSGAYGNGNTTSQLSPVQTSTVGFKPKAITAGYSSSFALKSDGSLWGWGYNNAGQLGIGTFTNQNVPVQIGSGNNWSSVYANGSYTHAIKADGTLWAWGENAYDQLGNGSGGFGVYVPAPVQVGADNNWKYVASSLSTLRVFALKADGTLWGWGINSNGELGNGATDALTVPTQLNPDNDWVAVASGSSHTLALKANGTLWVWGIGSVGEFGNGNDYEASIVPVQVGSDNDWVCIDAGQNHSLAIKSDGSLWTWGYNFSGQLGNGFAGTIVNTPVRIGTDNDWVRTLSGMDNYSIALKTNGSLWGWGGNNGGQLLQVNSTPIGVPTQLSVDQDWIAFAAGLGHSLALHANGDVCGVGTNASGELGTGSFTSVSPDYDCQVAKALPLRFLDFSGQLQEQRALLSWTTADEINTLDFEVERSLDGQAYQAIGAIPAKNLPGTHSYFFTDNNLPSIPTNLYYRLKQRDQDGRFSFSSVVLLKTMASTTDRILIYPNPVANLLQMNIQSDRRQPMSWQITDAAGKLIMRGQRELIAGNQQWGLELGTLPAGLYFLRVTMGGQQINKRFLKK
jgi:alpha-tubulin suppressor-like RCC1 family protein